MLPESIIHDKRLGDSCRTQYNDFHDLFPFHVNNYGRSTPTC